MLFGLFSHRRSIDVEVASFSECGPVRHENQDHVFVDGRRLVFCVADGMGGGEGGGVASEIVCREIAKATSMRADFPERVRLVDDAVHGADAEIRAYASKAGYKQMGTTATVLVADPEDGRSAAVGNIGDSRVYCLRDGELRQLTQDHTAEREIFGQQGARLRSNVNDILESMFAHMLTRAVGVGTEPRLEWRRADLAAGDVFLLCSDGVHGYVAPQSLKDAVSAGGSAKEIASRLSALVMESGAHDNYSAIVVKIGGRA